MLTFWKWLFFWTVALAAFRFVIAWAWNHTLGLVFGLTFVELDLLGPGIAAGVLAEVSSGHTEMYRRYQKTGRYE